MKKREHHRPEWTRGAVDLLAEYTRVHPTVELPAVAELAEPRASGKVTKVSVRKAIVAYEA